MTFSFYISAFIVCTHFTSLYSSESITRTSATKSIPSTQIWYCGNPTNTEQDALEHINRLRNNPINELTRIFSLYPYDPQITALLKPYQQRSISGELESLSAVATRLLTSISSEYIERKKVLPMSTAPLSFYPLIQQRASVLKDTFYNYEVALNEANPTTLFSPVYPGTQQPPTYLYSPTILFDNTYSDNNPLVWSGPNATNGTVSFGAYGGNETMITWCDLSIEQGIDLDALSAFLFLSQSYPALLTQGPYTPSFTLGNGRLVGIDISTRNSSPGIGDTILTADIADAQAFTSGSDLPYGPINTIFITGVVYKDTNSNGIYDSGEGVGGVTVSSPSSPYSAITSTSGGYCIPVNAGTGNVLVSIQTPTGNQTQEVSVNQDSVKVDFIINQNLIPSPLLNFSARSYINGSTHTLIAGFVIGGSSNENVLIRGIGPTLSQFGVVNALANPSLTIYNALGQLVAQNATWSTNTNPSTVATIAAEVGAFALPTASADSALLLNLEPGAYTAQVTGLNASSGEAMIEVYHVPSI